MNLFGFCTEEPDWINRSLDLRKRQLQHGCWIRGEGKQPMASLGCRSIFGPQAEDACDENPKWIARLFGNHPDDGLLPLPDFATKDTQGGMNFFIPHERLAEIEEMRQARRRSGENAYSIFRFASHF
jgi:hypothetical protein